jgi:opacity protein-like surface antigen
MKKKQIAGLIAAAVAFGLPTASFAQAQAANCGIAMVEAEASGFGVTASDDSTELTFGVGAQYDVSRNLGVRAQWQRYGADEDVDVISVGVVFKF